MRRTVIHIGPGKTGTTYIQRTLAAQRAVLASRGWLYPGHGYNQVNEFLALLGPNAPRPKHVELPSKALAWDPLAAQIAQWDGSVILSAESLARFTAENVETVVKALGRGTGRDQIDIVVTLRDLGRLLPSWIQENYKHGNLESADEFYRLLVANRHDRSDGLWLAFCAPGLIERWQHATGVGSVTVAVNPAAGSPQSLWSRFVDAAGLPLRHDASELPTVEGNPSLAVAQARLLRYLNIEMERHGEIPPAGRAILRRRVIRGWFAKRSDGDRVDVLAVHSDHWRAVVADWATEDVDRLRAMDIKACGDFDELRPTFSSSLSAALIPPTQTDPTVCADDEMPTMAAATAALLALNSVTLELQGEIDRLNALVPLRLARAVKRGLRR